MKKPTIEQRLLASRPSASNNSKSFTDAVMRKIKGREIISAQFRTTNVKQKETFIMKLRNLHKLALIAIALAITLATAGTAYAIYQLWPKPSVETTRPVRNQSGRFESSVNLQNCGQQKGQSKYEVKKGSSISPDRIPQILQAHCELETINMWAKTLIPQDDLSSPRPTDKAYDLTDVLSQSVYKVASVNGSKVSLAGQQKYGLDATTLDTRGNVKIVINSMYGDVSKIKPGDVVVPIQKSITRIDPNYKGTAGLDVKLTLIALVKLNLPFDAYDPIAQQSIAEGKECYNNAPDICVESGSVDLYGSNEESTVSSPDASKYNSSREIQGKLISYNATSIVLESSTGRQFTFKMFSNPINEYNEKRSANYNNIKIGIGDNIQVRYADVEGSKSLTANQDQIVMMQYMLEIVGKSDPIKKY